MKKKKQSRRQTSKPKTTQNSASKVTVLKEWIGQLVFAFVAMLFVHMFIFQPFVVPTPSMAGTVLTGEYLIASKLHYGAQTPHSIGVPYTDLYIKGIDLPTFRFPGFSSVKRGDVVVFHFPPEAEDPINKRQAYLKRALGLPGETISFKDKTVWIDGTSIQDFDGVQQFWDIYKKDARVNLSAARLKALGVDSIIGHPNRSTTRVIASPEVAAQIEQWPYVEKVELYIAADPIQYRGRMFPPQQANTPDNYGPVWIPNAGATIELNDDNWLTYQEVIQRHEGSNVQRLEDGTYVEDGVSATSYTFKRDYYFMIGDNRDNSLDSRFWGFVPDDHIMGKAVARFYSWDKEAKWPRFNRMLQRIR